MHSAAKVVDSQGERGTEFVVTPETRSERNRGIAIGSKMIAELIVGKDTGFFETIHAFLDLKVGISFGIEKV